MKDNDEINSPSHYMLFPDMEAIDVIKAALTPEEFKGYLKGNALKYRLRAGDKGPAEKCIRKSRWYQDRLMSEVHGHACQPCADSYVDPFDATGVVS